MPSNRPENVTVRRAWRAPRHYHPMVRMEHLVTTHSRPAGYASLWPLRADSGSIAYARVGRYACVRSRRGWR